VVNATNPIREATVKPGITVTNYVRKIIYLSLINTMKVTRDSIKLRASPGMKTNTQNKELLGSIGFDLTLIEHFNKPKAGKISLRE